VRYRQAGKKPDVNNYDDIDKFKSINDNYGHQRETRFSQKSEIFCLRISDRQILLQIRRRGIVIILPDTGPSEAEALAEGLEARWKKPA